MPSRKTKFQSENVMGGLYLSIAVQLDFGADGSAFGPLADLPLFVSDVRFQVLSRPNPLAVMILRCVARNGGADSSRRGKLAAGLPRFLRRRKARFHKPRAGLWNSGPRVLANLVGTRKLRVSHELLAKREDEVKRLSLLKGQG